MKAGTNPVNAKSPAGSKLPAKALLSPGRRQETFDRIASLRMPGSRKYFNSAFCKCFPGNLVPLAHSVPKLFLGLLLGAAWLVAARLPAMEEKPPNIVFILADDLGWKDLGCMGSPLHRTPNIDALRESGMLFTRAYSASPLCSPTRASILTGQYPARYGFTSPVGHTNPASLRPSLSQKSPPWMPATEVLSANRLDTAFVTCAERLKEAGYATGHFGKWHLGSDPYDAMHQGFDVDIPHTPAPGPVSGYLAPWSAWPGAGRPGEHLEERMAWEASEFIRKHRTEPFLLNYWAFSVHAPYQARPEVIEKFRGKIPENSPQKSPTMAAMVKHLDDAVGTLVATLKEAGLLDRTVIVFTSDNGGNMYDEVDGTTPTNNAPLRNGKGSIYEGGVRVPLIISWPGKVAPDSLSEALVSSVDFFPTLLQMAGLKPDPQIPCDGTSLVPLLLKTPGSSVRNEVFCHFPHNVTATKNYSAASLLRGKMKLIRFFARGPGGEDKLELYDLEKDPGETTDLSMEQPDLTKEWNAILSGYLEKTRAIIPPPNPAFNPTAEPFPGARKKSS